MTMLLVILAAIPCQFCDMDFQDTCLALTLLKSMRKEYTKISLLKTGNILPIT